MTTYNILTEDGEIGDIKHVQVERDEPMTIKEIFTLESLDNTIEVFTNQIGKEHTRHLNAITELEEEINCLNNLKGIVQEKAETVKLKG